MPDGAPENVVRTVTENSKTLKFTSQGLSASKTSKTPVGSAIMMRQDAADPYEQDGGQTDAVNCFTPTDSGPRIILLDLQSTLTANFRQMGPRPTPVRIRDEEQYRPYLVDWLREIQQRGWEVHLFTVRTVDRREATLESIRTKTGWQPDKTWFKSTETGKPPDVKSVLLDHLIPKYNPAALSAFESNPDTRRMFTARGIRCYRISSPCDLPRMSDFI